MQSTQSRTDARAAKQVEPTSAQQMLDQVTLARATQLARQGRYQQAQELLAAPSQQANVSPGALDLLARIAAQQGRLNDAETLWRQALANDATNETYQAALARLARAQKPIFGAGWFAQGALALLALVVLIGLGAFLLQQFGQLGQAIQQVSNTVGTVEQKVSQPNVTPIQINPTAMPIQLPVDQVVRALRADAALGAIPIQAQQKEGVLYLVGAVPSSELKERATMLAKQTAGIGAVDSSGIQIELPNLVEPATQALVAEPRLKGATITVMQVGSGLALRGIVSSAELKALATDIVGTTQGVTSVDNRALSVELPALAAQVTQLLQGDPRLTDAQVEVVQQGDGIVLKGSVADHAAKAAAEKLAHQVPGVVLVDSSALVPAPPFIEYVVARGDSLIALAERFYKDRGKWVFIYTANYDEIQDPAVIPVGMKLRIPK